MADKQINGPEGQYARSILGEHHGDLRRSARQSRKAEEDMADLRIAKKRLQDIKTGRSTIISGEALDEALHKILDS